MYPLYNQNEKLIFFLVELEPTGFVFVRINDRDIFDSRSMYSFDNQSYALFDSQDDTSKEPWRRFTVTDEGREWGRKSTTLEWHAWPEEYVQWETDKNGNCVEYEKSYYDRAGIENEQRYLLKLPYHSCIPAVKREDKWLNLISMEEMDLKEEITSKIYADMSGIYCISFFPKPIVDL